MTSKQTKTWKKNRKTYSHKHLHISHEFKTFANMLTREPFGIAATSFPSRMMLWILSRGDDHFQSRWSMWATHNVRKCNAFQINTQVPYIWLSDGHSAEWPLLQGPPPSPPPPRKKTDLLTQDVSQTAMHTRIQLNWTLRTICCHCS